MEEAFPAYHRKSEEEMEALWRTATFSFDTNILLHPYRYKPELRDELLAVWEQVRDRCWLANRAVLEYSRNCDQVIGEQRSVYGKVRNKADTLGQQWATYLETFHDRHPTLDFAALREPIADAVTAIRKTLRDVQSAHPDAAATERLREQINTLFAGKVGHPATEDEIPNLYATVAHRAQWQIPPGFMDVGEKPGIEQYGDAILWLQLLARAHETRLPIIFVTDDAKRDWWEKNDRPLRALAQEMHDRAGVAYQQYTAEQFLEQAKKYLRLSISDELIEEARQVAAWAMHDLFIPHAQLPLDGTARGFVSLQGAISVKLAPEQAGTLTVLIYNGGENSLAAPAIFIPDTLLFGMRGARLGDAPYHEGNGGRTFYLNAILPGEHVVSRITFIAGVVDTYSGKLLLIHQPDPGGTAPPIDQNAIIGWMPATFLVDWKTQ